MELNDFWKLIARKKQTIFTIMLVSVIAVIVISIFATFKYGSSSKILVMQDGLRADAYTISRTNEYLGKLFSEIIFSSSFFNLVLNNENYNIEKSYFSGTDSEQLKKWRKTISSRSYSDTGIVEINVFHPNQNQARQISLAINNSLVEQGHIYSGNENIKINVIDQPLVSERPVKPNIPYLIIITIFASFIFSLIFIYIFPEDKYSLKLFSKKNKGKTKRNKENIVTPELNKNIINQEIEDKREESLDDYYKKIADQEYKENEDIDGNIDNIIK